MRPWILALALTATFAADPALACKYNPCSGSGSTGWSAPAKGMILPANAPAFVMMRLPDYLVPAKSAPIALVAATGESLPLAVTQDAWDTQASLGRPITPLVSDKAYVLIAPRKPVDPNADRFLTAIGKGDLLRCQEVADDGTVTERTT